jgi:hypothetical protein
MSSTTTLSLDKFQRLLQEQLQQARRVVGAYEELCDLVRILERHARVAETPFVFPRRDEYQYDPEVCRECMSETSARQYAPSAYMLALTRVLARLHDRDSDYDDGRFEMAVDSIFPRLLLLIDGSSESMAKYAKAVRHANKSDLYTPIIDYFTTAFAVATASFPVDSS